MFIFMSTFVIFYADNPRTAKRSFAVFLNNNNKHLFYSRSMQYSHVISHTKQGEQNTGQNQVHRPGFKGPRKETLPPPRNNRADDKTRQIYTNIINFKHGCIFLTPAFNQKCIYSQHILNLYVMPNEKKHDPNADWGYSEALTGTFIYGHTEAQRHKQLTMPELRSTGLRGTYCKY